MTITELINKLEQLKAQEGDIRVCVYDEYTANEGWDFEEEDLYQSPTPHIEYVEDTNEKVIVL